MAEIKALTFDVFGTVVDWRGSVARAAEAALAPKGVALDWGAFADGWRARYVPAMAKVSAGERPFTPLDTLHRENLVELLAEQKIDLSDSEVDALNLAWHRLDPWPDSPSAMARLKRRFMLASLSNGNVRLMIDLARHAGLPWDAILGAEVARAYKPSPAAYDTAAQLLMLAPEACMLVAAHPNDLKAAARRGFRTAYVHRPLEFGPDRDPERPAPGTFDYEVDSFGELADALGA